MNALWKLGFVGELSLFEMETVPGCLLICFLWTQIMQRKAVFNLKQPWHFTRRQVFLSSNLKSLPIIGKMKMPTLHRHLCSQLARSITELHGQFCYGFIFQAGSYILSLITGSRDLQRHYSSALKLRIFFLNKLKVLVE
jgi:hypothetical protein